MLAEALLLSLAGLALGLALAFAGIRFLQTIPTADQVVIAPQLDHRVLIFSALVAAASALLFGLAPARQSLKTDLVPGLKTSDAGDAAPSNAVGRNVLVVAQIAFSMVLMLATGMLLDGFRKMLALDPGFRTDHVMVMSLDTELVRYTPAQTHAFYRDLVDRARALRASNGGRAHELGAVQGRRSEYARRDSGGLPAAGGPGLRVDGIRGRRRGLLRRDADRPRPRTRLYVR